MKKTLILFLVMVALMTMNGFAWALPEAWSVGTDYEDGFIFGGVDTSNDAIMASEFYSNMGFNASYAIAPTYHEMRGRFTNGNYRLESAIQFYSGHANHQSVAFNHMAQGGDYKTGVYYGKDKDTQTGYRFAGIESYDLSNVVLITFAGCNTASNGDDNITAKAYRAGAKVTVGWTDAMGATSHSHWLERYNDYLNQGQTVEKAIEYADSFNYFDNRVKKHKTYGNTNIRFKAPQRFALQKSLGRPYSVVRASEVELKLSKMNPNFRREDYMVEKSEGEETTVYDYFLLIDGVKSTEGYTVIVEGKIAKIYTNALSTPMLNDSLNTMSFRPSNHALKESQPFGMVSEHYKILTKEPILDSVSKKKWMYYRVEHILEEGLTTVIEYYEEI